MNVEKLKKQNDLRKRRIITKEEFNNQKNKFLNKKKKSTFLLLAFFLGFLGIHNFYVGQTISGIFKLILFALSLVLYLFALSLVLYSASLELALSIVSFLFMGVWLWVVIEMCITKETASGVSLIPASTTCKVTIGIMMDGYIFLFILMMIMIYVAYVTSFSDFPYYMDALQ